MDSARGCWYFSNMPVTDAIPDFTLFGETEHFPGIVHCETFLARAPSHGWRISTHRHMRMAQIFLISSGRVEARVDGRESLLKSGKYLFVPAQKAHEFVFETGTEGHVVSVRLHLMNPLGPASSDVISALTKPFIGDVTAPLNSLADLLATTSAKNTVFQAQRALGLAHSMLALIAEDAIAVDPAIRSQPGTRLFQLDELITRHMRDGWTASDYAAKLAISTGHLSRLCRAACGYGATAYIELSTMEEACRLLAVTRLPISEIGYRLGYADASYFSKRFRMVQHQAPSEYRAQFSS